VKVEVGDASKRAYVAEALIDADGESFRSQDRFGVAGKYLRSAYTFVIITYSFFLLRI